MKQFTIDACKWYVDREQTQEFKTRARESFRARWTPLHTFLRHEGLIRTQDLTEEVADWSSFEISSTDLTEEGFELFRRCHDKWLSGADRGTNPENITRWITELKKLRAQRGTAPAAAAAPSGES